MPKDGVRFSTQATFCDSLSAWTIALVMVFRTTVITIVPAPAAMIAPMAAPVVDHRRWTIIPG